MSNVHLGILAVADWTNAENRSDSWRRPGEQHARTQIGGLPGQLGDANEASAQAHHCANWSSWSTLAKEAILKWAFNLPASLPASQAWDASSPFQMVEFRSVWKLFSINLQLLYISVGLPLLMGILPVMKHSLVWNFCFVSEISVLGWTVIMQFIDGHRSNSTGNPLFPRSTVSYLI